MKDSKILEFIIENLKTSGKYIMIRDKNDNVVFPRDIESVREIERFMNIRSKGKEFFDKITGNNYVIKSTIFYDDSGNEYIFDLIENNNRLKKFEEKSKYDSPTKLLNKESILTILDTSILNKEGLITTLGVCVCDIDYFKNINDTYGHLAGDKIISQIAGLFKKYENQFISVGRFGGDEFVFVFKNKNSAEINKITKDIKDKIENISIKFNDQIINDTTMSFGIYIINDFHELKFNNLNEILEERGKIFDHADEALYESKQKGRNRITLKIREDIAKDNNYEEKKFRVI